MSNTFATERLGIAAVQMSAAKLGQIWRETQTGDFGIDGHLEFLRRDGIATGMIVGVQVKSGASYLERENGAGFLYTASAKHQSYWEQYPVPVLLVLHDPDADVSFWLDVRQEFRSGKAKGGVVLVPKQQVLQNATVDELFANAGVNTTEYISDIGELLNLMLCTETKSAGFNISFFDIFCLGLTNIGRSLYFGMDLVMMIAEHKLANSGARFGMGLGGKEYEFLDNYIRLLVSQNLVHANYSDLRIDLVEHNLVPLFVVPLSLRGLNLRNCISGLEDKLVSDGALDSTKHRATQEAFVQISEISILPRILRVDQVRTAILSRR